MTRSHRQFQLNSYLILWFGFFFRFQSVIHSNFIGILVLHIFIEYFLEMISLKSIFNWNCIYYDKWKNNLLMHHTNTPKSFKFYCYVRVAVLFEFAFVLKLILCPNANESSQLHPQTKCIRLIVMTLKLNSDQYIHRMFGKHAIYSNLK